MTGQATATFPKFTLSDNLVIDASDDRVQKQGLRIAVIGESGSGKSYMMALIAEQAIKQDIQVMIIDVHGEYWTFAEKFPNVIVVGGENADLPLIEDAIDIYAEAYRQGKILDFNLKEIFTDEEAYGRMVEKIIRALWKVQVNESRPAIWLMEEAHLECPQEKSADVMRRVGLIKGIATGGRKFGVLLILGTQRPAELHKTPLSQCWLRFFGKLTEKLDRDAVKDYMKPLNPDVLKSLVTGEFYVYGWAAEPFKTTITSKRITRHGAETPLIAPIERVEVSERASIDELRQMIEKKMKDKTEERTEIATLKGKLTAAEKTIEQLREKTNIADVLRDAAAAMAAGTGKGEVPAETLTRLEQLEKREGEIQELEFELKRAREQYANLEGQLKKLKYIQDGIESLRRGFGLLGLSGSNGAVDVDSIVREVIKRVPSQGNIVLEPKEFILKDYQQREVDRILADVSELTAEQKDLLRFVAGIGKVDRREAARAVFALSPSSFSNRAWSDKWNRERLFPIAATGAVKWDSKHSVIIYSLPDTVEERLQVFNPTPEEINQVVASIEALFAKEKTESGKS
jgi:ABC-type dipeptide/oligopeptide/nickel transport system ATPase component